MSNSLQRRASAVFAAALGVIAISGCEVTNPGPVDDAYIALPASQAGLVNGSWERMNRVIGSYSYNMAMSAREIFHGGQTGSYGHNVAAQAGSLGDWDDSGPYNNAQQARWIAEEAIRQFTARGDVANDMMTKAYLAAGYANRVMGDFFCVAVFDGGPIDPEGSRAYYKRAEAQFTEAIALAPDNTARHAALAGRAQARLALEDWAGALADAKQVPDDFRYLVEMDFSKGGLTGQRNHVQWASADSPFRSFTVRFTYYDLYYEETGDPRTPWAKYPNAAAQSCVGALQGFPGGAVPCTQQRKYLTQDDDIEIASGGEMRLIEAEAMLRQNPGAWAAAMTVINANRTRYISNTTQKALEPWTATNLDEAWTFLMRERGIEFWLEGRRFADMRRWERYIREYGTFAADGQTVLELPVTTPGTLDWPKFEDRMLNPTSNLFTANPRGREAIEDQDRPRELCYNISNTERENNPNINERDDDITP
jgi:tetratricopeptide (TPR) repeat protein